MSRCGHSLAVPLRQACRRQLSLVWLLDGKEITMKKSRAPSSSKAAMTPSDAGRIQGSQAKSNGGRVAKGSFAARALAAAARNARLGTVKK